MIKVPPNEPTTHAIPPIIARPTPRQPFGRAPVRRGTLGDETRRQDRLRS
jgi:hypothetical protein